MNIELKPIAESKVRQLGGDVCGVLVRNEAGVYAAVDEHGRVQWLQGDSEHTAYLEGMNAHLKAELKAASAQGCQGAEAVYQLKSKLGGGWDDVGKQEYENAHETYARRIVYTQPQPAVPEGWRECLQEMVQAMYDYEMSVEEDAPYKHRAMMDRAHALLSTPTTPQADGWVRCDERLPTEEDWWVWIYDSEDGDIFHALWRDLKGDYENGHMNLSHWMPTGLKRPQPPQEGSGDEH
jgi:hypothetical protein